MKSEWKKLEKDVYLPKTKPSLITIKPMNYFVIDGEGDPNVSQDFNDAVQALYSLSYGIKMMPKSGVTPDGYYEYTVYPLEGIWDMIEAPIDLHKLDKSKFKYSIMIRQPDFVTKKLACEMINRTIEKKKISALEHARFETIEDGLCVQMLHIGSYDNEAKSFDIIHQFCEANGLERTSHSHREIYLSDPRRTSKDQLKTVLRVMVKHKNGDL